MVFCIYFIIATNVLKANVSTDNWILCRKDIVICIGLITRGWVHPPNEDAVSLCSIAAFRDTRRRTLELMLERSHAMSSMLPARRCECEGCEGRLPTILLRSRGATPKLQPQYETFSIQCQLTIRAGSEQLAPNQLYEGMSTTLHVMIVAFFPHVPIILTDSARYFR